MSAKDIGQQHGSAVRQVGVFAVKLVIAFGKDIVLNARRGAGYVAGFAQGVVRPNA